MPTSADHPFGTPLDTTAHPTAAFRPPAPAAAAAAGPVGRSGGPPHAASASIPSAHADTDTPMEGCLAHTRHPHLHPPPQRTLSEDAALSRPDPMAAHSPTPTASTTSSGQRETAAHHNRKPSSKQQQLQQQQRGGGGGSGSERRSRPGGAMEWEIPDIEQEQRYIREHIRNRTLEPLSRLGRAPSPERYTHAEPGSAGHGSGGAASGSQGGRPRSGTPGPACTGSPRPGSAGGRAQRRSSPVDSAPCGGLHSAGEREAAAQWQAAWQAGGGGGVGLGLERVGRVGLVLDAEGDATDWSHSGRSYWLCGGWRPRVVPAAPALGRPATLCSLPPCLPPCLPASLPPCLPTCLTRSPGQGARRCLGSGRVHMFSCWGGSQLVLEDVIRSAGATDAYRKPYGPSPHHPL